MEKTLVAIRVADSGRGISEDELTSIFQMFVQGKEPINRIGSGLGVGLALARNIVELHGGTLEAYSAGEGQGSAFTVRLPIDCEPVRPQANPANRIAAKPPTKSLMMKTSARADGDAAVAARDNTTVVKKSA